MAKTKTKQNQHILSLVPNYDKQFLSLYSNYAVVSHTKSELCIDFCLFAPPHAVDIEKKTANIPVIARILFPAQLANGLITALQDQLSKCETDTRENPNKTEEKQ